MTNIEDLKIYIVTNDIVSYKYLKDEFIDVKNVFVCEDDIRHFYNERKEEIDCLVSPANAFGYMTGGYDAALSDILGWDFQEKVRKYIKDNYYGEQPVSSSFIMDTDILGLKFIHTPTMQYPSVIKDDMMVYYCTRSTLICALTNNIKCIVLPVFGGACGMVKPNVSSRLMKKAYIQIRDRVGANYDI